MKTKLVFILGLLLFSTPSANANDLKALEESINGSIRTTQTQTQTQSSSSSSTRTVLFSCSSSKTTSQVTVNGVKLDPVVTKTSTCGKGKADDVSKSEEKPTQQLSIFEQLMQQSLKQIQRDTQTQRD